MTTPSPEPVPDTTAMPGSFGHIEAWISRHVAPELADLKAELADARIKAENTAKWVQDHAAVTETITGLLVKAAAADPALAHLAADAEQVAAEAARIAAEINGSRM
jgi:ribosomal protein S16